MAGKMRHLINRSGRYHARLKAGDIILSFNGAEVDELRDLTRAVAQTAPDATAEVVILHRGTQVTHEARSACQARARRDAKDPGVVGSPMRRLGAISGVEKQDDPISTVRSC